MKKMQEFVESYQMIGDFFLGFSPNALGLEKTIELEIVMTRMTGSCQSDQDPKGSRAVLLSSAVSFFDIVEGGYLYIFESKDVAMYKRENADNDEA